MTDLKTIALLQEKATKGPWIKQKNDNGCFLDIICDDGGYMEDEETCDFIAACGSFDFPALCDEMERMRKALEMISALACYATEEDTGARENALIEIGKHARDGLGENR